MRAHVSAAADRRSARAEPIASTAASSAASGAGSRPARSLVRWGNATARRLHLLPSVEESNLKGTPHAERAGLEPAPLAAELAAVLAIGSARALRAVERFTGCGARAPRTRGGRRPRRWLRRLLPADDRGNDARDRRDDRCQRCPHARCFERRRNRLESERPRRGRATDVPSSVVALLTWVAALGGGLHCSA